MLINFLICKKVDNGVASPLVPSPLIGSRGAGPQRRKPLAVSVDDQRNAGSAAAIAAGKALRADAEKQEKVRRGSVFSRRWRNRENRTAVDRPVGDIAGYVRKKEITNIRFMNLL
jgi:hypothetical protein